MVCWLLKVEMRSTIMLEQDANQDAGLLDSKHPEGASGLLEAVTSATCVPFHCSPFKCQTVIILRVLGDVVVCSGSEWAGMVPGGCSMSYIQRMHEDVTRDFGVLISGCMTLGSWSAELLQNGSADMRQHVM
eukprot:jgi/Chrzof1/1905/Cz10g25190.t1